MHPKQKGNIGSTKVILALQRIGANVFVELGDLSKIDLVAEINSQLLRLQVKYVTKTGDVYSVPLVKSGPGGYNRKYRLNEFDAIAAYLAEDDLVVFIPFVKVGRSVSVRTTMTKNGRTKGTHYANELTLDRLLRDFTPNTQQGEDKVQTTT